MLSGFAYGQVSDWISFEPGSVRNTITTDRSGLNYNSVAFDAVYPAPAGNDYSLIVTSPLVWGGVFDTSPIPDDGARVRIVRARSPCGQSTSPRTIRPSSSPKILAIRRHRTPRSCRPGRTTSM